MEATHVHLVTNHFPIIGVLFGLIIMGVGLIKNNILVNTGLVIFILIAVLTLVVMTSGGLAEEIMEDMPGVEEKYIEDHESSAATAGFSMYGLGILALITLVLNKKRAAAAKGLKIFTFLGAIVVFILMVRAGADGGEIRHPEIRNGGIEIEQGLHD